VRADREEDTVTAADHAVDLSGSAELDPPGTRRGIGVVAPFDFALDDEYLRWLGPGVGLFATRTPYVDLPVSVEMAEAVGSVDDIAVGARALRAAAPAAVVYACTSGSFVGGLAGERRLRECLRAEAGVPGVTTSGALLDALAAVRARAVAVATPYDAEVTARLGAFLAEAGHAIAGCAYLGLDADIARVNGPTVHRLVTAADSAQADAVFVSCTNLRTFDVIGDLERELGKPVLTANQVSVWAALRAGGLPAADVDQRLFRGAG
jgi:maleate isomerase